MPHARRRRSRLFHRPLGAARSLRLFRGSPRAGSIVQRSDRDLLFVTGFAETVEALLNKADFSSTIAAPGPVNPLPYEVDSDDISEKVNAHSESIRAQDLMINYDGEAHTAARSLLNPLLVPSRLKANEAFMESYADEIVRAIVAKGTCEIVNEVATPYVTLVIADLLGVPAEDREQFRTVIDAGPPPGNMDAPQESMQQSSSLAFMVGYFARYLAERRASPQKDVMTDLAMAKYPDGSTPDIMEPAKAAMFLFAAGQDTSAKLLGNAVRYLAEETELQDQLRADPSLIPAFIEEMLRLEGSTKMTARLAVRKTKIGDVAVPAGKRVFVGLAAANRDPRRWEDPGRVQAEPTQDQGACRFRARRAYLRRGAAGPGRSAGAARAVPRPDFQHCAQRGAPRQAWQPQAGL